MTGQCMPCRSTKCPSWTCAFQRFIFFFFLTVIVKCVPGEVHLGYVMTSYGTLYFHFACGISGGHMFLPFCRTLIGDTIGHFLQQLLLLLHVL